VGLRLLRPTLLVPSRWAIKRLLDLDSLACVGERIELESAVAIPLPHPPALGLAERLPHRVKLERALGCYGAS